MGSIMGSNLEIGTNVQDKKGGGGGRGKLSE